MVVSYDSDNEEKQSWAERRRNYMTVEDVKKCYIEKNMTLVETAKSLHANLTVLHNFVVSHNLVKDKEIIHKFAAGGEGRCI